MLRIAPFFSKILWQIILITAVLSWRLLLELNLSGRGWNEVDVLPLAKQYADPAWIPQDWYLNQAAGYRLLFNNLAGWLIVNFGFLATSIIGRLICYCLVATGLVLIGQKLKLSLPFLILATICCTYLGYGQGAIAGEWFVGGLEAKAFAYGLILIAVAFMLRRRYLVMTLFLGLATSFHVLVGGWAFLTTLGWLCFRPSTRLSKLKEIGFLLLLIYCVTSVFAIPAVAQHLLESESTSASTASISFSPSFIYVFLRLAHHLNPLSWDIFSWIKLIIYLLLLRRSMMLLHSQKDQQEMTRVNVIRLELGEFALISLIPFLGGLAIALFDRQGNWLQYYPFRFGDVMLPIIACLLTACTLESYLSKSKKSLKRLVNRILIVILLIQTAIFIYQAVSLQQFPTVQQDVNPQWKAMSNWIREHTPKDAVIVSHPIELVNFSWLTERGTIAKVKLFPQTDQKILEYYQRIDDLSGSSSLEKYITQNKLNKRELMKFISDGFENLSTDQAKALMNKYQSQYFLTTLKQHLDLEVAYRYDPYILYHQSSSSDRG
ncbi:hypothetical protein Sta7437_3178 [Stanieria cyanosphaera PCC 7437]|uniref:DUF6798 domain-containing protein n=1 Tax=Stanieria cyanosphaera (strain ATCC 29371 / PCC 7437) TaxID=111780 RepID=K9XX61_STAC7|nr:DUF6798 domain-containing protein [Stanieria cyanosphaera]AFZ36686.1 hypothetical protein Sta7437_3178 [Stanieria cyanosphaera PCC 7437]